MDRLRVLSGREVCEILQENGFVLARHGQDAHDVYQIISDDSTITVPVPMHRDLAIGTLSAIIRQSHLPRSLFEVS